MTQENPKPKTLFNYLNLIISILFFLCYLIFRTILHSSINDRGFKEIGLVQYDSFYQLSFANELKRMGDLFLFKNPFGSFDSTPFLFNFQSTLLSFFSPLNINSIFTYELIIGSLACFILSLILLKLAGDCHWLIKLLILFGGGVGFVSQFVGASSHGQMVDASFWLLTNIQNYLSLQELIYHTLFYGGIYYLVKEKIKPAFTLFFLLSLFHPFTFSLLFLAITLSGIFDLIRHERKFNNFYLLCLSYFAFVLIMYQYVLPQISGDAFFLKGIYQRINFRFPPTYLAYFYCFPLLALVFLLSKLKEILKWKKIFVLFFVSIFCLLVNFLPSLDFLQQPSHYIRSYPYCFLIICFGLIWGEKITTFTKWKGALVTVLVIAVLDSALCLSRVSRFLVSTSKPPHILSSDEYKIIEALSKEPPAHFAYYKKCPDRISLEGSTDFEYAVSALTLHKVKLGHIFFSPYIKHYPDYFMCQNLAKINDENADLIMIDEELLKDITFKYEIILSGTEHILLKNLNRQDSEKKVN